MTAHLPVKRVPAVSSDGPWRYWHPHGWVIYRNHRDWRLERGAIGGGADGNPKHWWEVKRHATSGLRVEYFDTLGEAREWCDQHYPKEWM